MQNPTSSEASVEDQLLEFEKSYKNLSKDQFAERAVDIATKQIMACYDFKKPRMARINKYYELYDGKVPKKIRQLFNVPIPVFPGMIDTLNAQYDTPIQLKFTEGDPSDYFKVQKINGAWYTEMMDTSENTKWDSKLSIIRKHAIISGRGIAKYTAESDPEYKSNFDYVNLKNFNFQPRGGLSLENHLFAGEEDLEKTKSELIRGARSGLYDKNQVVKLLQTCAKQEYLPDNDHGMAEKLARFKPLGLNPDNHAYVGDSVYTLSQHILEIDGQRYFLVFHPWSKTWLRFERWSEICSSDLYPWDSYATHEDDENFLSKSFGDDLYPAADAIVAMFNQELTNREKRNFGPRAYDKDMFTDLKKLDDAMHRPDALVPADTKGGTRRIADGIYEFKVGELGGTVNLIDWITGSLGRNTGANDLAQGSVAEVSKKASVTFAEQKSISKRIGWASRPFQTMISSLGKKYIYGLKDHMPASMAIKVLGPSGWDWDQITRLELDTSKDINVLMNSTDKQMLESEMKAKRRQESLTAIGADPALASSVNPQWRAEQMLRVGEFDDVEVAVAMDTKTYGDKKSLAHAADSIQMILRGQNPDLWYGATPAFMQRIVDFATENRATLKDKFDKLISYAVAHEEIAMQNMARKANEFGRELAQAQMQPGAPVQKETSANPGLPGGVSKALSTAQSV